MISELFITPLKKDNYCHLLMKSHGVFWFCSHCMAPRSKRITPADWTDLTDELIADSYYGTLVLGLLRGWSLYLWDTSARLSRYQSPASSGPRKGPSIRSPCRINVLIRVLFLQSYKRTHRDSFLLSVFSPFFLLYLSCFGPSHATCSSFFFWLHFLWSSCSETRTLKLNEV